MCGIAGFILNQPDKNKEELNSIINKMNNTIVHRGPDDAGIWCDENAGVSLGHRRLSIIDLSSAGHQPMISQNGRFIIVMNGEIYNHRDLSKEMNSLGYSFIGDSDTEVALACIQHWGVIKAMQKFVGMFAFGIWDRENRKLYLSRDRMGEKPLYYGRINSSFVFASELKALKAHPGWQGEINRDALSLLMKYTYIPSPYCIYVDINKLEPGTILEWSMESRKDEPKIYSYWSADKIVLNAMHGRRKRINKKELINELDDLLHTTLKDQMIADVPLGAFLSGGIDSSAIVAIMQSESSRPVKTFSIGFHEDEYNEAVFAKQIAEHLGTDHTELYVTPEEAQSVIPKIPELYDEPFSDSSQIPTFLISELARKDVTVALSGDGGDELFGGYSRYLYGLDLWNKMSKIPEPARNYIGNIILKTSPDTINKFVKPLMFLVPKQYRFQQFGQKLQKLANAWNTTTRESIYRQFITLWPNANEIVINSDGIDNMVKHELTLKDINSFPEWMMFTDMVTYLPDDILTKVDRASMAVSLEVRVPFLDHRIVEFIWNQAPDVKIVKNVSKWLLREVLYKYVPKKLIDRPKMGFGVPIDHWLRGPLREWAEDLISEERLKREGYLKPELVRARWEEHLSGNLSWHYHLWPVLMFQAWKERWINN